MLSALIFPLLLCLSANATLEKDLRKFVASYRIPEDRLGLYVVDLNQPNHPVLLDINGEKNFIPASLTKILTASAILQKFGPSYKFETDLLSDAKREGDALKGPLYLRGGGDPGFVSETMWLLVNEFYRTGIKQVGDIVVDESAFDSVRFDESRDKDNSDRAYDAPVGAMSFNWNSVNVYIRPTQVGKPPKIIVDPEMKGWEIANRAKTTASGRPDIRVSRGDHGEVIFVDGKIPVSTPELVVYKSILDPVPWTGEALRSFLKERGITATGVIRSGKTPASAQLLAKIEGQPVRELVIDMMKFSNNFVAEMLTKDMGAKFIHEPAHLDDGVKVVRDVLLDMGLKKDQFEYISPSGLSRKNSIRPSDLVHILNDDYKRFSMEPEFLSALPLAGVDGTLRSRFKNSSAVGWIRGKTGHLHGVAGLAGFAGQKEGGVKAFAFIFNGPEEQGDLARRLFDALASKLVQ